ncbi:hypothetical protein KSD_31390 [Ktedonobacter sp. SOSP1-85]|nr:hypothetical protein KSD_31390 [Ktedonobacter sp. SOSP1-85]
MKKLSTVSLTQATYKGTPHSSPCLKGQGHPAAISVNSLQQSEFVQPSLQLRTIQPDGYRSIIVQKTCFEFLDERLESLSSLCAS